MQRATGFAGEHSFKGGGAGRCRYVGVLSEGEGRDDAGPVELVCLGERLDGRADGLVAAFDVAKLVVRVRRGGEPFEAGCTAE